MIEIDYDWLHAAVQFPAVLVQFAVCLLMIIRWYDWKTGRIDQGSASVALAMAALMGCIAVKNAYWQIVWTLRAADLYPAAKSLNDNPTFAMVCNAGIIVSGLTLIGIVGRNHIGRYSVAIAFSCGAVVMVIGQIARAFK